MSETEEYEEYTEEKPKRELIVKIEDSRNEKLQQKAKSELYDKLIIEMRESLNNEFGTDLFNNCSTFDSMKNLADKLGDKKSIPTGVVGLRERKQADYRNREYETPQEMIAELYKQARLGDTYAEDAKNRLLGKTFRNMPKESKIEELPPKIKSSSNRYVVYDFGAHGCFEVPQEHAKKFSRKDIFERVKRGVYG